MSCELLAGPWPITVDGAPVILANPMGYADHIGLWAEANDSATGASRGTVVFDFDGVGRARNLNSYSGGWDFTCELDTGEIAWTAYRALAGWYYGNGFDPLLLRPLSPIESHVGWSMSGIAGYGPAHYLIPEVNRFSARIRVWRRDRPGGDNAVLAYQASMAHGARAAWMAPADEPGLIWLMILDTDGRIELHRLRYTDLSRESVRWLNPAAVGIASPAAKCWYSPRFRIFLVLHASSGSPQTQQLSIWSRYPSPVTMTVPRLDHAPQAGIPDRITVTLAGFDGEPIVGRPVDWTVAGSAQLLNPQTVTDAMGVAQNWVIPALGSGDTDVTVTAESIV